MAEERTGGPVGRLLREHPALIVSAVYVFATAIGMFYSWSFMRQFGVNVFLYAEIGDFLLVSFKDPIIWAVVAVCAAAWSSDIWMSKRWGMRERPRGLRWYGTKTYRLWGYPVAFVMICTYLYVAADVKADRIRGGYGEIVNVSLAEADDVRTAVILDATSKFVFLYERDSQTVRVHPHEGIAEISFVVPGTEQ